MWESRRKYNNNGVVGYVYYSPGSKIYFQKDRRGVIHPIDQKIADGLRAAEESIADAGRPSLFPDKAVTAHSISLPDEVWENLEKPFSLTIYNLIKTKGDT